MAGDKKSRVSSSLKDFLAELEDLMENLNRDLTALEDLESEGGDSPELINSLFRSFHTIKGLAGMLSLGEIGTLAHSLEDLLDAVRLGRVDLNDDVLGILSKGLELLGMHAKAVSDGSPVEGQDAFLRRIAAAMSTRRETAAASLSDMIGLPEEVIRALTEYEEHRLRESIKGGRSLYLVHKAFSLETFDTDLNRFLAELKTEGEVISTLPSTSAAEPTSIRFDLLWSTALAPHEALERFSLKPEEVSQIDYEKGPEESKKDAVSSTLRSLSETVRVDIKRLDSLMAIVGELVIYKTHLGETTREISASQGMNPVTISLNKTVKSLERSLNDLQKGVIEARMVPIGQMFGKLHRVVRKISRELGKDVELRLGGEETELDKLVIEDMADPLLHLIRNAIDHGIEPPAERIEKGKPPRGLIDLCASQKGNHIVLEIEDDGAGMDSEKIRRVGEAKGLIEPGAALEEGQLLSLIFRPGFSTCETVTELSGRGVGLDIVKNNVSRLGGMINVETEVGVGTRITVTLPMTLAIIQALLVRVAGETFAIPISSVLESVRISKEQICKLENKEVIRLRDQILPLLRLDEFFGLGGSAARTREGGYVVVVGLAEKRIGMVVDSLRGQQEIVIKSLGELLRPVRGIAGATELGNRRAVLVLDVGGLIQEVTYAI